MSKILSFTDEAYQLPVDTVYILDNRKNNSIVQFVDENTDLIESLINDSITNRLYRYEIKAVRYDPDDRDLRALYRLSNNNLPARSPLLETIAWRSSTSDINYDIVAHIIPGSWSEDEHIRLLTDKLRTHDKHELLITIIHFAEELNTLNIRSLTTARYPVTDDISDYPDTVAESPTDAKECDAMLPEPEPQPKPKPEPEQSYFSTGKRNKLFAMPMSSPCESRHDEDACRAPKATKKQQEPQPAIDPQLIELAERIKRDIDTLQRNNGINILMEKLSGSYLLRQLQKTRRPLSRIVIDDSFRILLPDYDCEIRCPDLSKAVYILFLRHPEGIRLKEIEDYKDELRQIYFTISPRSDMYAQNESINSLTDPISGSLNQKISRISAAFRNCLDTESTQPYIISGQRGAVRKIQLAADMISLPTELQF